MTDSFQNDNSDTKLSLNTIYNMDCVEGMKLIPDGSIDCIITDQSKYVLHSCRI